MFRIDRTRVNVADIIELQANIEEIPTPEDASNEAPETEPQDTTMQEPEPEPEPQIDYIALAREEADIIIKQAHRDADALRLAAEETLRRAEADSEGVLNEAKKLGYELGYNEARAEGDAVLAAQTLEVRQSLERALAELERGRQAMLDELEGDIIDLCFSIVRKISSLDRNAGDELFRGVIKKALSQLDISGSLILRLSQEDCERFFPDGEASFEMNELKITIPVAADLELEPGDITLESDSETLIAGAATQLRKIELSFKQMIGKSNEEY